MFLKPDTVGIIPRRGYRLGDCQSIEAIESVYKTNAAIWYNKICREKRLKSKYINMRINGKNQQDSTLSIQRNSTA